MQGSVNINIKEIRKEKGITQQELANLSGLSKGAIQQYEYGTRKPKIKSLMKIVKALNCDISDITNMQIIQHGYWIKLCGNNYKCSICGDWWETSDNVKISIFAYCPHCGAKMNGKGEDK